VELALRKGWVAFGKDRERKNLMEENRKVKKFIVILGILALVLMGSVSANVTPAEDVSLAEQENVGSGPPLTILVAGYGWYYGIPEGCINNAEAVAMALDGEMIKARDDDGRVVALGKVHSIAVPVTWDGALLVLEEGIAEFDPDIIVGLGTSGAARSLRPEPFGSNVMKGCDAVPPETPGIVCYDGIDDPILEGGDDWVEGNLPYTEMVVAMLEADIPARRGHTTGYDEGRPTATPGWYLCNYMTYNLALMTEENPELMAGFIHIPQRPEYSALFRYLDLKDLEPGTPEFNGTIESELSASIELQRTIDGVRICLEECLRAGA